MGVQRYMGRLRSKGWLSLAIDTALEEPEKWKKARWRIHPSGLGELCDRALMLSVAGHSTAIPAKTKRYFENGHDAGARWERYLKAAKVWKASEVPISGSTLPITGRADFVIRHISLPEEHLIELKTINDRDYSATLPTVTEDPVENVHGLMKRYSSYVFQWTVYAVESGIPRGFLIFEGKNTQEFKVYPLVVVEEVREQVYGRIEALVPFIERRVIPLRPYPREHAICAKCGRKALCDRLPDSEIEIQLVPGYRGEG